MEQPRQQRRQRDRERTRLHPMLYRQGLGSMDDPSSTILLVHHLMGILRRRGDNRRASKSADAVHKVFDVTLARCPTIPALDCKVGCTYCCSLFVSAAIPEILLLAGTIRRGDEQEANQLTAQITRSRRAAEDLTIGDMVRKTVPCGLLSNSLCAT